MEKTDTKLDPAARQEAGTAPRVTPEQLNENIVDVEIVKHVSHAGQVLRWAVLTVANGFAVTGRPSASVSPENDDSEVGVAVAISNAKEELWPLMGYELKQRLHNVAKLRNLLDGKPQAGGMTAEIRADLGDTLQKVGEGLQLANPSLVKLQVREPEQLTGRAQPGPVMAQPAPVAIHPTVGRVVWFWPTRENTSMANYGKQPMAAQIAFVQSLTLVNLTVTDHAGRQWPMTSVQLLQEGDERPAGGRYAEWMPYQVGQARKA